MSKFEECTNELIANPKTWLITGVAGFIGSNLLEYLLRNNQRVVGLDNFVTGYPRNLYEVERLLGSKFKANFTFIEGDITDLECCKKACTDVDYVLHQAALGSVPRSIENPIATTITNVLGFVNILDSARQANVSNFVYAASSSTYGDSIALPKVEEVIGNPLSPYAVTKYVNEIYADVYLRTYDFRTIGLRYFNVFGPRQSPNGAYAAVIPKWIAGFMNNEDILIFGDGSTSRDFCYVDNVVEANILASVTQLDGSRIYNVALGDSTSLNQLSSYILDTLRGESIFSKSKIKYLAERKGDVKHSRANITKIKKELGFEGKTLIKEGLQKAIKFYLSNPT